MPFALIFIGLVCIVSGSRNTYKQLGAQLITDFSGPGNFTYWLISMGVVGAVGYAAPFRKASHLFLALIVISMVLKNGGLFDKFYSAIQTGPVAPKAAPEATASSGGSGSGGDTKTADSGSTDYVKIAMEVLPLIL